MQTMADTYRAQFENGMLDRMAGSAIQTKAQFKEANPAVTDREELEDLYRVYRNGFTSR